MPNAAERAPSVLRHQPLGRIFNDEQVIAVSDGHDDVHLAAHSGVMHDHDGFSPRRDRGLDEPFVEVERVTPHVEKYRHTTTQNKRVPLALQRCG